MWDLSQRHEPQRNDVLPTMISKGPREPNLQDLPCLFYIRRPIKVEDINAVAILIVLVNNAHKNFGDEKCILFSSL